MASAFPCLDTLELVAPTIDKLSGGWRRKQSLKRKTLKLQWPHWTCPIISSDSLPQVKLKLKTFLLIDPFYGPLGAIADAVLKTGAKILKLGSHCYNNKMSSEAISALRQQGVVAVPIDEHNNLYQHMS